MLSPAEDDTVAAVPIKVENRGKQRDEAKESSNSDLLELMKEIREEMRGRDE